MSCSNLEKLVQIPVDENDTRGDLTEVKIQGGKSTLLIEQNTKDVPSPHGLSQEPTSTVVFGISTGTETVRGLYLFFLVYYYF